jgi:hypothetical protein
LAEIVRKSRKKEEKLAKILVVLQKCCNFAPAFRGPWPEALSLTIKIFKTKAK